MSQTDRDAYFENLKKAELEKQELNKAMLEYYKTSKTSKTKKTLDKEPTPLKLLESSPAFKLLTPTQRTDVKEKFKSLKPEEKLIIVKGLQSLKESEAQDFVNQLGASGYIKLEPKTETKLEKQAREKEEARLNELKILEENAKKAQQQAGNTPSKKEKRELEKANKKIEEKI